MNLRFVVFDECLAQYTKFTFIYMWGFKGSWFFFLYIAQYNDWAMQKMCSLRFIPVIGLGNALNMEELKLDHGFF